MAPDDSMDDPEPSTSGWRALAARPEMVLALALGIGASVAWIVLKLASEISEGDTTVFDRAALIHLRALTGGNSAWQVVARQTMGNITALGNGVTLTLLVLLVAGFLVAKGQKRLAALLVVDVAAGVALVMTLKDIIDRARPEVVPHLAAFQGPSFPSGHAANSAIVYLSLAVMIVRITPERAARIFAVAAAGLLTILIGLSRIYLGVHWPSDVLGGWAVGSGWAAVTALMARWMQLRTLTGAD